MPYVEIQICSQSMTFETMLIDWQLYWVSYIVCISEKQLLQNAVGGQYRQYMDHFGGILKTYYIFSSQLEMLDRLH